MTSRQRCSGSEGGEEGPLQSSAGRQQRHRRTGEHGTRRHRSQGVGELSQVQQHRLGSEADDGDGGDVGETVARVATVTMKVA